MNYFMSIFIDLIDTAFPLSHHKQKYVRRPMNEKWFTSELQNLKEKCLIYYNLIVYHGMNELRTVYNQLQLKTKYKNDLKTAKMSYYAKLINDSCNKSKTTWSIVSKLLNNSKCDNNSNILNNEDFNCFFIKQVDDIVSEFVRIMTLCFLNKSCKPETEFEFKHVSVEDVYSIIIKNLTNSSCTDV